MPLKTFVKVGSITNLSDARYCAGMGVDLLGFRAIEGYNNYIRPAAYQEIRGWITGPLVVIELYGMTMANELDAILENYKPDYLEMSLRELSLFSSLPLPLLLSVGEDDVVENLQVQPQYLVSKRLLHTALPLLIEIDSTLEIPTVLENQQVKGLVLQGSDELKPGLKDFQMMADVLELLEVEG